MLKHCPNSMKPTTKDIFEWDVVNWSKALDIWKLEKTPKGKALTIGERGGGLSLFLAKKNFQVICTDLNPFPESTKAMHIHFKVDQQITYQKEDVLKLSFPDNTFDCVMFKSVIGALSNKENQVQSIAEIYRVLKPGGRLLFAENLNASKLHQKLRKRFIKWNIYWRYLKWSEDLDLFDKFEHTTFQTHGFLAVFGRSEKQRNFLGRIDAVLRPIIPKRMRYILMGVCRK